MDHAAVAKKIREAIFDHAESEGRVIQDSIDGVIEGVLRKEAPNPASQNWYGGLMTVSAETVLAAQMDKIDVSPGRICWAPVVTTDDEYR